MLAEQHAGGDAAAAELAVDLLAMDGPGLFFSISISFGSSVSPIWIIFDALVVGSPIFCSSVSEG